MAPVSEPTAVGMARSETLSKARFHSPLLRHSNQSLCSSTHVQT